MMNNIINYDDKIAFSEVYDIICFMDNSERTKIPSTFIEFLKTNKQENYITKINPYIPLEFQKISKKAQNIIAYIYIKYLANNEEKMMFRAKEQKEFEEERKSLEESYNTMFNRNAKSATNVISSNSVPLNSNAQNLPIIIKKQNIFIRIINCIKNIFLKK